MGRKTHLGVLGSADDLAPRLGAALVAQQGLGPQTVVASVGDGAQGIWERVTLYRERVEILDVGHAAEHAWACVRVVWGERSARDRQWADEVVRQVKPGHVQGGARARGAAPATATGGG